MDKKAIRIILDEDEHAQFKGMCGTEKTSMQEVIEAYIKACNKQGKIIKV